MMTMVLMMMIIISSRSSIVIIIIAEHCTAPGSDAAILGGAVFDKISVAVVDFITCGYFGPGGPSYQYLCATMHCNVEAGCYS